MRSATQVIHNHLMRRLNDDLEGDIEHNYAENVVLLTGSGRYQGADGVRSAAAELQHLVGAETFTYTQTVIAGPYGFLEWTAQGEHVVCDGADSFVIYDGLIHMQSIHYTPHPWEE